VETQETYVVRLITQRHTDLFCGHILAVGSWLMPSDLARVPPADVRRALRLEVGFGCPVPRCRSPFLEYHHFDPEWHVEHHHRLEGLIPLCPTHHAQAAAFTIDQLRQFKKNRA
jgi:hypothetical protein